MYSLQKLIMKVRIAKITSEKEVTISVNEAQEIISDMKYTLTILKEVQSKFKQLNLTGDGQ